MKIIWIFLLFLFPGTVMSQSKVKIRAYSQIMMPGMVPKNVTDENGNPVNIKKEYPVNYYIYAVYKPAEKIIFSDIWLKGHYRKVKTNLVESTPVINFNYNIPDKPIKVILVPATKLKVVSITPDENQVAKMPSSSLFKKLKNQSELIVSYLYKGKKYFIGVKKIKKLEPIAGM